MNWVDAYEAEMDQGAIWREQAREAYLSGDQAAFVAAMARWEASMDKAELIRREEEMAG